MKNSDLIKILSEFDPDLEVTVAVYGCGGYEDSYPLNYVEPFDFGEDCNGVKLEIYRSCDAHHKLKNCSGR